MFDITDVECGWLTLHISDFEFVCSYITDVKYELEKILHLRDDVYSGVCRICLDGERPELFLTCFVEEYGEKRLHIIWEEYGNNNDRIEQLIVPYESFCNEIKKWFEDNKEYYHDNFGYEYD